MAAGRGGPPLVPLLLVLVALLPGRAQDRPEAVSDPPSLLYARMAGLVVPHGYDLEEHFATTVDGYVLRLFRIPGPPRTAAAPPEPGRGQERRWRRPPWLRRPWRRATQWEEGAERLQQQRQRQHQHLPRPVVHLQHGLLGSSTDFVLNGPGLSLPLMLADKGFDVWFGNVRGNVFSRNHTRLDLVDPAFWEFSWDDMASKDLPAMLTYELVVSGAADLAYVGHSQGTTVGLAFLAGSTHAALAERVRVAVLLAPVAFVSRVDSPPLITLATLNTDEIFTLLGIHEFMPSSELVSRLEGQLCRLRPELCVNLLAAICGYNPSNLDTSRLPTYLNYTPSGTSVQNMAHWAQAVRQPPDGRMYSFDYGTSCRTLLDLPRPCNQEAYGQLRPPAYNLSAIATPLALFTGGKDRLADPADTARLLSKLPPGSLALRHHEPDYEHLDFIWGINAPGRVYSRVLRVLGAGDEGAGAAAAAAAAA